MIMYDLGHCLGLKTRKFQLRKLQRAATVLCRHKSSIKILYFGSDSFSIGPLNHLVDRMQNYKEDKTKISHIEVVTTESPNSTAMPMRKRKTNEFIDFVKENNIDMHTWNKENISNLASLFDFGIVASFGHLIPKKIIQNFSRGMLNAHSSLLPRWRGAAPIIHTVLNGDTTTGVSIIDLSVGRFDRGSIFLQKEISIPDDITTEFLTPKLGHLAGEMVLEVIDHFDHLKKNKFTQSESSASSAPKVSKDISFVNWSEHTGEYLNRLHRAIGAKIGVHTYWKGKLVRLIDIKMISDEVLRKSLDPEKKSFIPGQVVFKKKLKLLCIKCIDGWISVSKLQVECKKPITAADFYNAYMVDRTNKLILYDRFS